MLLDFFNVNSADLRMLYSLELEYFNLKNIFYVYFFISSIVFPNIFDVCAPPIIRYGLNLLSFLILELNCLKCQSLTLLKKNS